MYFTTHTIQYEIIVDIAAPKGPISFINKIFNIILIIAPKVVDFAKIEEVIFAEKIPPSTLPIQANRDEIMRNGTNFHAS